MKNIITLLSVSLLNACASSPSSPPPSSPVAKVILPNPAPLVEPISTTLSAPTTFFENGKIKFYFATGSTDLADNALEKSQTMIQATKQGKFLGVESYMSDEDNETKSRELMKARAEIIKTFLIRNGVPANQIKIMKPDLNAMNNGNRVEVFVLKN